MIAMCDFLNYTLSSACSVIFYNNHRLTVEAEYKVWEFQQFSNQTKCIARFKSYLGVVVWVRDYLPA